jgi:hypothetical protein
LILRNQTIKKVDEGMLFGVPLPKGGFAIGLIARKSGRRRLGGLFGYFFGPRRHVLPTAAALSRLRPSDASLLCMFGYLGIRDGRWPYIGKLPNWDRGEWPMPSFTRTQLIEGTVFKTTYDENDPGHVVSEESFPPGTVLDLPDDSLFGDVAVAIKLDQLLTE